MEEIVRRLGVQCSRRGLVHHAGKIVQVMLQGLLKAAASTKLFTEIAQNAGGWTIVDVNVHQGLHGSGILERYSTIVFKAVVGTPTNLAILNPVFVHSVPFVVANDVSYPVAALVIAVCYLLHEAHKLREVVEVREKGIHLVNRRIHCYRCMMLHPILCLTLCHTISFPSELYVSPPRLEINPVSRCSKSISPAQGFLILH